MVIVQEQKFDLAGILVVAVAAYANYVKHSADMAIAEAIIVNTRSRNRDWDNCESTGDELAQLKAELKAENVRQYIRLIAGELQLNDDYISAIILIADIESLERHDQYAVGSIFEKTETGLKFKGCETGLEGNGKTLSENDKSSLLNAAEKVKGMTRSGIRSFIQTDHWKRLSVGDKISRDAYLGGRILSGDEFLAAFASYQAD